ncbi:MAG TPA: ribonuclease HI, partial [Lactobacillus sp.]|nr:ribonuclease HI [Lactobacillus sp.]
KQDITKRYAAFVEQIIKKEGLQVQFQKISAHTGVKFNERADQLAKQAAEITS